MKVLVKYLRAALNSMDNSTLDVLLVTIGGALGIILAPILSLLDIVGILSGKVLVLAICVVIIKMAITLVFSFLLLGTASIMKNGRENSSYALGVISIIVLLAAGGMAGIVAALVAMTGILLFFLKNEDIIK